MSDAVQGALVGGGFAFLVAAMGYLFSYFSTKAGRVERYRVALYDKRLAVHQQAFDRINKLLGPAHAAKPNRQELEEAATSLSDWWDANALYLDPTSSSEVLHLFGRCFQYARGRIKGSELWSQLDVAQRSVVRGIGTKHVDLNVLRQRTERDG